MAVAGEAGKERPGTTVRPGWLELERHCKGWIEIDEEGRMIAINVNEAEWENMRLHVGEPLRVVSEDGTYASSARTNADGDIVLERHPPSMTVSVLITRVRGVPSCALHEIERTGRLTNEQAGDAIGRHRTLVARDLRRALQKAEAEAKRRGIDRSDFLAALAALGRGSDT